MGARPIEGFEEPPAAGAPQRVDTGGRLDITIHDNRAPTVRGAPNDPRQSWSVNQGPAMVTP
jgi:hypothetical protein